MMELATTVTLRRIINVFQARNRWMTVEEIAKSARIKDIAKIKDGVSFLARLKILKTNKTWEGNRYTSMYYYDPIGRGERYERRVALQTVRTVQQKKV